MATPPETADRTATVRELATLGLSQRDAELAHHIGVSLAEAREATWVSRHIVEDPSLAGVIPVTLAWVLCLTSHPPLANIALSSAQQTRLQRLRECGFSPLGAYHAALSQHEARVFIELISSLRNEEGLDMHRAEHRALYLLGLYDDDLAAPWEPPTTQEPGDAD